MELSAVATELPIELDNFANIILSFEVSQLLSLNAGAEVWIIDTSIDLDFDGYEGNDAYNEYTANDE